MKIRLVPGGVFPITRDKDGNKLKDPPKTGFQTHGTLQGEGKLLGTPSIFIRLAGCNLRCSWKTSDGKIDFCDTPYSSHNLEEVEEWEIADIIEVLKQNLHGIKHVIISGGEPTLQNLAVTELAKELKKLNLHITLETNGVLFFPHLSHYIDLFSISPKLRASEPNSNKFKHTELSIIPALEKQHKSIRKNLASIQKYINYCHSKGNYYDDGPDAELSKRTDKDFQLKFVISSPDEDKEIREEYLNKLANWTPNDILLMPLGSTQEFLENTFKLTAEMAIKNKWRFTPRLHIDLFDNTQYV